MSRQRNALTRRGFLAASATAAAVAAATSNLAWSQGERVLRFRRTTFVRTFDPGMAGSDDAETLQSLFPGLIRFKPTYRAGQKSEWELDAAASVEQRDPTHITFALRPGIAWTNGFGEMTAEDVKYSYERLADPAHDMLYRREWAVLRRVDVIDPSSGVIMLNEPSDAFLSTVLPFSSGAIVSKKAVEAAGGGFTTAPPATAGPYVIEAWTAERQLVLVRNAAWTGPRPVFDEVRQVPIPSDKAAERAFAAGDIDFVRRLALSSLSDYVDDPPAGATLDIRPAIAAAWFASTVTCSRSDNRMVSVSGGVWANLYRDTIRPATSADGRRFLLHRFERA